MTNSKEKSAHTYQKRKERSAYYYLYDEEEKYKEHRDKEEENSVMSRQRLSGVFLIRTVFVVPRKRDCHITTNTYEYYKIQNISH